MKDKLAKYRIVKLYVLICFQNLNKIKKNENLQVFFLNW